MAAVNLLLLVSHDEPVENNANEIANNAHGVKQVVSGLHINGMLASLQSILSEVHSVVASLDRSNKGSRGDHESPVGEWNEEAMPVHVQEISHIAHQHQEESSVPHSLRSIDLALLNDLLLA